MSLTFAAKKKEPLAEMAGRIRQAFLSAAAGPAEPVVRFTFVDFPLKNGAPVDRVLKRHPDMQRFVVAATLLPGAPGESRMLSNAATGDPVEYPTLEAILTGVPRSYPFSGVWLHFYTPAFGERLIGLPKLGHSLPGVIVTDNSWITGRQRALMAYTVAEAAMEDKELPPNPPSVDAVIKALGKPKRIQQVPILAPGGGLVGAIPPANAAAVKAMVAGYRARLSQIVEQAAMPHALPPAAEIRIQSAGVVAGPRKPALLAAFKPLGYACRGGTGEFHITRRTSSNLTIELYLDVGTWSHQVTAMFLVHGAGFRESLVIPVAPQRYGQYPIGDAAQWQKIVDNLTAMVRELERGFVPEIEQAAGPTPAWYQPPS